MGLKFRRGTTAQKSGSLAFGEPYVNTTLGTLQIGGATGDITLGASGTGSTGTFGDLNVTGNAIIDGNLTLGGQLTIGDATSDTINVVASLSSSLIPAITNVFDLGSADKIWKDLYISTGSIKFVDGTTVVATLDLAKLSALEAATGSANSAIELLNSKTGSYATTGSNVFVGDQTITGSLAINDSATNFLIEGNAFSQTYLTSNGALVLNPGAGGIEMVGSYRTFKATDITAEGFVSGEIRANNGVVSGSSQVISILSSLNTYTGSNNTKWNTLESQTGSFVTESETGSFARINTSNIFTNTQTITGSMFISGDLVVQGSSSLQNITASAVSIGTNIVQLNVATPAVRFAGLQVIDSGSTAMTASLYWDSVNNHWVYQRESGAVYGGGMLIAGPRNLGALGDEVGMTSNRLAMGIGGDHISSSQVYVDNTGVSIPGNLEVTGSLTAALTGNATTATTLQTARTINGTSFNGSANITIPNLVSGSSQIDVASTTGDIALGSRTSGNYVASLVAGTNITLSNNSGEGATPTIGLTNNTISGIALGSNLGTLTIGTGLSGTSYNGSTGVTITNTGVTSNVAGTGISVSGATGAVTITNTGVTSAVAGTGVSVSSGTGAVTISIGQSVATSANAQFNSLGIGMAASATAGRIDATNDIVAFSSSDIRFKENITPIENALDKISKISGNTYDWKAENKIEHGYEGNDVGVIAQEIEAVLPQLVQTRENGFKAVKYDKLVALLIQGIKEQQLQIEELKAKIGL